MAGPASHPRAVATPAAALTASRISVSSPDSTGLTAAVAVRAPPPSLAAVIDEQSDALASGTAETAVLLVFAYAGFSAAEAAGMSGIVAALFCGILMNHYTQRVLSRPGRATAAHVFKMAAGLADTAIFLQIGITVMLNLGKGAPCL